MPQFLLCQHLLSERNGQVKKKYIKRVWPRSRREGDGVRPQGLSLDPAEAPSAGIYHSILSAGDTYRLALKGILPPSPLVLTDYRFSCTAPTKHHSGLAARQSVPLELACSVSLLHFYVTYFLAMHDLVEKLRSQRDTFTPLLVVISKSLFSEGSVANN